MEIVQYLLERGANKEAADTYDMTPLCRAVKSGFLELVQYLVEQGAGSHHIPA